jgi:hypothetical protein
MVVRLCLIKACMGAAYFVVIALICNILNMHAYMHMRCVSNVNSLKGVFQQQQ